MSNLLQDGNMKPKSVDDLLLEFNGKEIKDDFSLIKFTGMEDGADVYNITAPFLENGEYYIAGRVEARDSEDSRVVFFRKTGDEWTAETDIAPLKLQDPFVTRMNGQVVLGGVEIFDDEEQPGSLNYRTVFFKGDSIRDLKQFATGPDRMKDIRLCQLGNEGILVMTRPQGKIGGRGKIGYLIIDSLDQLNADTIESAKVLQNQFLPEEWGGCNELHLLSDGKVGILSHIAKYDGEGNRHYYATAFCFDYKEEAYSPMKIIAVRDNFKEGPSKRDDLYDVIFSGGLVRENGSAELYCGVSDTQGHRITIRDPFLPFVQ